MRGGQTGVHPPDAEMSGEERLVAAGRKEVGGDVGLLRLFDAEIVVGPHDLDAGIHGVAARWATVPLGVSGWGNKVRASAA